MKGIRQAWHWLVNHDPFSIVAAWLIPHRAILGWASLFWLLIMLPFAVLRWNAIATLWGIIGAGLLVSVILQEQGEALQRRVWLRGNRAVVNRWVGLLYGSAGLAVTFALGLADTVDLPLRMGPTVSDRRKAIEQAREIARSFGSQEIEDDRRFPDFTTWVQSLSYTQSQFRMALSDNGPLFDRLIELHGALREFDLILNFPLALSRTQPPPDSSTQREARAAVARAALDILEQAADVLHEAGAIK